MTRGTFYKLLTSLFVMAFVIGIYMNYPESVSAEEKVYSPYESIISGKNASEGGQDAADNNTDNRNADETPFEASVTVFETSKSTKPEGSTPVRILVYHSHTTEAYLEEVGTRGEKLASRSGNYYLTVNYVGEVLCDKLAEYGIDSDHDKNNNEAEGYGRAYILSKEGIYRMIEENGEYSVYIDLHRDSYSKGSKPTVEIDGRSVARIMLVVGGRSEHGEADRALAEKLMKALNEIHPQLCEKVLWVSSSDYNQISDTSLLIEIGDNGVSVSEAAAAAEYAALALAKVINT